MVLTFEYLQKSLNIIFRKINIHIPLPPIYVLEVWDYIKVNFKSIQKAIQTFYWVKAFRNVSVDGKVDVLNETLMNIFRYYSRNQKVKLTTVRFHG